MCLFAVDLNFLPVIVSILEMALLRFGASYCNLDCVDVPCSTLSFFNLSNIRHNPPPWTTRFHGIHVSKYSCLRNSRITCDSSPPPPATVADAKLSGHSLEDDFSHVTKFSMSDFIISDRVTVGFTSRADETIFEATLKDRTSPLYNNKVVLRRFTSVQAKRRGRRAIEVLKKLARRRLMYHSYSMHVYGYVCSTTTDDSSSFTLVHGYHGSFSLRHWLQQSDWLPTLEATLALDEESARRVGDDSIGGPTVARQLRLIRILMRDLLIGVNYLHSHGLAHTELRLENIHLSPVDRHIKVGLLGNATDLHESDALISSMDRRKMMIAFDMRCVGFIMAKMVLPELMDSSVFMKFKAFLTKGNDPSCLREFLMRIINKNSALGNAGLQILDRNWGAGWNLLSLLLATKLSERISCLNALRHPFLCGPRWRVDQSLGMVRWSLGSAAVRITEEYIYKQQQRSRLAYFVELMEMLNPCPRPKQWLKLFPGKWRLLYWTGKHIGLTLRQPSARVLVGDACLICQPSEQNTNFSLVSNIGFTVITGNNWPHDKLGVSGKFQAESLFRLRSGRRLYLKQEDSNKSFPSSSSSTNAQNSVLKNLSGHEWKKIIPIKEFPSSLPVIKLGSNDVGMSMSIDEPMSKDVGAAGKIINEVRIQIPPEMFDVSKIVCGTYIDARLLVLRSVNGSALLFTRSCDNETDGQ